MVAELPKSVRGMKIEPMEWWEARELFMETYYDLWYGTREIRYENNGPRVLCRPSLRSVPLPAPFLRPERDL